MSTTNMTRCDDDRPVTIDSGPVTPAPATETVVMTSPVFAQCCDVWANVPDAWLDRVRVRAYARLRTARVLLRQVLLERVPMTPDGAGRQSGIAISVRGRPCDAVEVTLEASAGDPLVGTGLFHLQVWRSETDPYAAGGDLVPEIATSVPMVAAALLARDGSSGAMTEVATDASGRLVVSNPFFTEADKQKLDDATATATPDRLVKRDGAGATELTRLELPDTTVVGDPVGESWLYSTTGILHGVPPVATVLRAAGKGGVGIAPETDGGSHMIASLSSDFGGNPLRFYIEDRSASQGDGAGYELSVLAGKGRGSNIGGTLTIGGGAGGTPGLNLSGPTHVQLGALVGPTSADFGLFANTTQILNVRRSYGPTLVVDAGPFGAPNAALALRGTNVSIGGAASDYGDGLGVAYLRNATVEPSFDPSDGGFVWATGEGQLRARGASGILDEIGHKGDRDGPTKARLRREKRAFLDSTGANVITLVPASDLPSATWSGRITVEVHAYTASGGVYGACRKATVVNDGGSITVITPDVDQIVGVTDDTTSGVFGVVFISTSSGDLELTVDVGDVDDAELTAWADVRLREHDPK